MSILKTTSLFMVATLAFLPGIAAAASVDIKSGSSRVVIDRDGQVYIRNKKVVRDVYYDDYDSDFDEDLDRVIPRVYPYSTRRYRPSLRNRYYRGYRGKCKGYSYSRSSYGSSTYSSSTVCN